MLAAIGWILSGENGLQTAANWAQLVSVVLAIPALLVPLWVWRRTAAAASLPGAVTPTQADQALHVLAGLVHRQWNEEAVRRSLDDPVPIPVRWRTVRTSRLIDHPDNLTPGTEQLEVSSGDIAALADAFRSLRRRRLVLLGGAGTGKTTLAVQLVRELLKTRADHELLPVLVSVAGWDTDTHLRQWLGERIIRDYPALRSAGLAAAVRELAENGRLLPVLDGLDELPEPARAKAITALNGCLSDTDQLILTSRTDDYKHAVQAGDVLTSATVISPQLLRPEEAAHYLERCLPVAQRSRWQQVLQALRTTPTVPAASAHPTKPTAPPRGPGAVLASATSTAWGLWLLRTVYIEARTDPEPLLDTTRFPTSAALRTHLLDALIPALITARPPSDDPAHPFRPRRRHDPDHVRRWLTYLARTTNAFTPATRILIGRVFGLIGGLVFWLMFWLMFGFIAGLTAGLIYGDIVKFAIESKAESWQDSEAGYADLRLRGRASALARHLKSGLSDGRVFGPTGGLMVGLVEWAEAPATADQAVTPNASWRADRTLHIVRTALAGGVYGLVGGFVGGLMGGLGYGLVGGLMGGLGYGLAGGLIGGLAGAIMDKRHHAWMGYVVATRKLAFSGALPRKLMPFLDDAHRLGLLRAVGPVYQFRHADLHDHLAGSARPTR